MGVNKLRYIVVESHSLLNQLERRKTDVKEYETLEDALNLCEERYRKLRQWFIDKYLHVGDGTTRAYNEWSWQVWDWRFSVSIRVGNVEIAFAALTEDRMSKIGYGEFTSKADFAKSFGLTLDKDGYIIAMK